MQVTLNPGSPAEVRLIAAFMQDLAELQELQAESWRTHAAPIDTLGAPASAPTQAEAKEAITPAKKTRSKKTEPAVTAEAAAESGSSETAQTAGEAGNAPAPAATEPAASTEAPAGTTASVQEDGQSAHSVTLDELRVLFGQLTEAGKRTEAITVVRGYGANGLAEIAEDKRGEVFAKLKAL